MSDSLNRNAIWAGVFLDELARTGVRDVCISPGSRSTPLVLAVARDPRFRSFVHLDERSSGYFALGIGKATGRPALVITTSGTAAANLYPSIVEASQAEVPLIVATADRPHRLRGADANQAIDQLHLFGSFVRAFFEVAPPEIDGAQLDALRALAARSVALATGLPAGPVHLNFPFEKPLEPVQEPSLELAREPAREPATESAIEASLQPRAEISAGSARDHGGGDVRVRIDLPGGRSEGRPHTRITARRLAVDPDEVERVTTMLCDGTRAVILAGPTGEAHAMGPAARRVAHLAGLPLLADPLSGARFGPAEACNVIAGYDLFLRDPELRRALAPDIILRLGMTPTSAVSHRLLDESNGSRQVVIDGGGRWKDHHSGVDSYIQADGPAFLEALAAAIASRGTTPPPAWLDGWRRAERITQEVVAREVEGDFFEGTILAAVAAGMQEGESLFVSSSMPVRDLDAFGVPGEVEFQAFGNRGASGIDGIVSTALGLSAGGGRRVVAVVGDIAFYHDMNGLLAARGDGVDVTFVVIHNDGGGIFSMLPIREHEPDFTPFFATPHGLDFQHAARLYDLPYTRVTDARGLRDALGDARGGARGDALGGGSGDAVGEGRRSRGCRIIEVATDREENRRRHREVVDAVRAALVAAHQEIE